MSLTTSQLFDAISPLLVALHEAKALDIAEVPHYYEDAIQRRLDLGETQADVAFQQQIAAGIQRLALAIKGRTPPT